MASRDRTYFLSLWLWRTLFDDVQLSVSYAILEANASLFVVCENKKCIERKDSLMSIFYQEGNLGIIQDGGRADSRPTLKEIRHEYKTETFSAVLYFISVFFIGPFTRHKNRFGTRLCLIMIFCLWRQSVKDWLVSWCTVRSKSRDPPWPLNGL